MRLSIAFMVCVTSMLPVKNAMESEDALLRKVIVAYGIQAYAPLARPFGPKETLGQALFFDPFISGPRSIACATCHVRSLGAGDGLPVAVGLGAEGVSKERMYTETAFVIPRNALPFFNRGSKDFIAFFWDGRVQQGAEGRFESPIGSQLPGGFDNLLAVATAFPLAEPDEMLGHAIDIAGPKAYHGELVDSKISADNFQERTLVVFNNLVNRLLAPTDPAANVVVKRYRELFRKAYPNVELSQIRIQHVGNALASYITAAFELNSSPWDNYVSGNSSALTDDQKRGALIFFGKGRCAVCHSGKQFSDFRFHGLAIPQGRVGKQSRFIDYGRASATGSPDQRFAFRTPPLRNVLKTAPWGHNGSFNSLEDIIRHHSNPLPAWFSAQRESPEAAEYAGQLIGFRSPILAEMPPLSKEEITLIVKFLSSLSSSTVISDDLAVPTDVPSGNREFIRL